jgi:hypothetical protein
VKLQFKHYLHDEDFDIQLESVMQQSGYAHLYSEDLRQKVGRPFYEVELRCTLDTDTGTITVDDVKL